MSGDKQRGRFWGKLAKALNGSVWEHTLCLSKFNNINSGVIGNEWVKSEEVQLSVMYIQFSLRHFKILSAHQSFFFFSNDNKLIYWLRKKQCYSFTHFDLLSVVIDGFVHLIFCKRVGRPLTHLHFWNILFTVELNSYEIVLILRNG